MMHLARKAATLGALAALLILVTAGCRLGPAQTHPGPEPKNTAEAERTLPTPKERPGSGETPWPPSTGELQDPGSDTPAQERRAQERRAQAPENGATTTERPAQRPQNGATTTERPAQGPENGIATTEPQPSGAMPTPAQGDRTDDQKHMNAPPPDTAQDVAKSQARGEAMAESGGGMTLGARPLSLPEPGYGERRRRAREKQEFPPAVTFMDYQQARTLRTDEDAVSTFGLDTDRTSYMLALNWP